MAILGLYYGALRGPDEQAEYSIPTLGTQTTYDFARDVNYHIIARVLTWAWPGKACQGDARVGARLT